MEIAKQNFQKIIREFPKQFAKEFRLAKNFKMKGVFESVIVCGMGGSGWPAEMLKDCLRPAFPMIINKTYGLPPETNKKSLVVISSYSGNTEEPLNCLQEARKRGFRIVGLTTGGKLKEICQKENLPLVLMPDDVPAPRLGCGYAFAGLIKILIGANLIKDISRQIQSSALKLDSKNQEKIGQSLARAIGKRIPVVYASHGFKSLSYVWKIKLNETAKIPAFANYFPELNHNELSAYAKSNANLFVLVLRDGKENKKILKRMDLTAGIIKSKNIPVKFIDLKGKDSFEKTFNGVILADWTSFYLARKTGADPVSVALQEQFKKNLR